MLPSIRVEDGDRTPLALTELTSKRWTTFCEVCGFSFTPTDAITFASIA